jgi:hypothetical protein
LIVVDTSALVAAADVADPRHHDVAAVFEVAPGPFLVSPFVLAETDYLVRSRWGVERELALLDQIKRSFEIAPFDSADLSVARRIIARYADQEIGLADASIVVLAARHRTRSVLTLDERHFRVLRTSTGKPFEILPAPAGK